MDSFKRNVSEIEPLLISEGAQGRDQLIELTVELVEKSAGFSRSLPSGVSEALANLVRSMNCYYSNLIEGHDTHPIEIEKALQEDYSNVVEKRNLQLEAKAHIEVQKWIDNDGLVDRALTTEGLCEIHRRFCELLPDELLWVENPRNKQKIQVIPGELRKDMVKVGNHIPPIPEDLDKFLKRFETGFEKMNKTNTIISAGAAHHRMVWIHPFIDGNGRVARLMSYSMLRDVLETNDLWSIARGLARNVEDYKRLLAACDMMRRNDLDGRGHLSETSLMEFGGFFLKTCIDQIDFMEELFEADRLEARVSLWVEEEIRVGNLPKKSDIILNLLLLKGKLERSEIIANLDVGDRQARRVSSSLISAGVAKADSSRAPLKIAFPAKIAARWLPRLFPDQ